nr:MAG TPA: hypothetical protein [Caudoviricetes sp.]DAP90453.1 MAG TPA: hypothetical protein [Caudoviricetes sp.]DAP95306.1 MAG TPA: hypothetical protein [Caudoviricetes sp.]
MQRYANMFRLPNISAYFFSRLCLFKYRLKM